MFSFGMTSELPLSEKETVQVNQELLHYHASEVFGTMGPDGIHINQFSELINSRNDLSNNIKFNLRNVGKTSLRAVIRDLLNDICKIVPHGDETWIVPNLEELTLELPLSWLSYYEHVDDHKSSSGKVLASTFLKENRDIFRWRAAVVLSTFPSRGTNLGAFFTRMRNNFGHIDFQKIGVSNELDCMMLIEDLCKVDGGCMTDVWNHALWFTPRTNEIYALIEDGAATGLMCAGTGPSKPNKQRSKSTKQQFYKQARAVILDLPVQGVPVYTFYTTMRQIYGEEFYTLSLLNDVCVIKFRNKIRWIVPGTGKPKQYTKLANSTSLKQGVSTHEYRKGQKKRHTRLARLEYSETILTALTEIKREQ